MYTQQEYKVHFQSIRQKYVKIQILNSSDKVVDQIETDIIDGNINIDAQSPIRRTCDLKLKLKSEYIPSISSQIWLNKRFKLWIGIKDILTDDIVYFNKGIYVISNPIIDIQITEKTISIKGYDKMCLINGEISGYLKNKVIINENIPIHEAIRATMSNLGGENKLLIETHEYNTPYKIEKSIGNTIWDIIEELKDLYMDYQAYYDNNGYFRFDKIKNKINDSIIWNFNDHDFRINSSNEINFNNIKNNIIVYGKLKDDGIQPKATVSITEANNPNNPFKIDGINGIGERSLSIEEDKYYTIEACQQRANYELWKHSNFLETISISCVPIYLIDVNNLVEFNSVEDNVIGKYIINNINESLRYDGLMNIQAYKIY